MPRRDRNAAAQVLESLPSPNIEMTVGARSCMLSHRHDCLDNIRRCFQFTSANNAAVPTADSQIVPGSGVPVICTWKFEKATVKLAAGAVGVNAVGVPALIEPIPPFRMVIPEAVVIVGVPVPSQLKLEPAAKISNAYEPALIEGTVSKLVSWLEIPEVVTLKFPDATVTPFAKFTRKALPLEAGPWSMAPENSTLLYEEVVENVISAAAKVLEMV